MNRVSVLRLVIAASLYLMLVWGYLVVHSPQIFAAFAAAVMGVALLFWSREATIGEHRAADNSKSLPVFDSYDLLSPELKLSMARLDALKAEIEQQYARLGRDYTRLNIKSLGAWHGASHPDRD